MGFYYQIVTPKEKEAKIKLPNEAEHSLTRSLQEEAKIRP